MSRALLLLLILIPAGAISAQSLFPIRIVDRWGYIDRNGVVLIEPQFDEARSFSPDHQLAAIRIGEHWGLVDTTGRVLLAPSMRFISNSQENSEEYYLDDSLGSSLSGTYHDGGLTITERPDPEPHDYSNYYKEIQLTPSSWNGYCGYEQEGKFGYVDSSGQVRIPAQYGNITRFAGPYAGVNRDARLDSVGRLNYQYVGGTWHIIDTNGQVVLDREFEWLSPLDRSGRYWEFGEGGRRGVISPNGVEVLPPDYENLLYLSGPLFTAVEDLTDPGMRICWNEQVINRSGEKLLPSPVQSTSAVGSLIQANPLLAPGKDPHAYLLDSTGRLLTDVSMVNVEILNDNLVLFATRWQAGHEVMLHRLRVDGEGKYRRRHLSGVGLMNRKGEVLVRPDWEFLHPIQGTDSLFLAIAQDNVATIIAATGRQVIPFGDYTEAELVAPGIIKLWYGSENRGRGDATIIGRNGRGTEKIFRDVRILGDNLICESVPTSPPREFPVEVLRDMNGEEIFTTRSLPDGSFIHAASLESGLVLIGLHSNRYHRRDTITYRFINLLSGYTSREYAGATWFNEGVAAAAVRTSDSTLRWGYIDEVGGWIIEPRFDSARNFSDGLAPVATTIDGEQRWGFIDRQANWVIQPQFDGAKPFSEGRAAVLEYGDSIEIYEGSCGLGYVGTDRERIWGYIDRSGTVVIPVRFLSSDPFIDGCTRGITDSAAGLIDRNGNWLFDSTTFQSVGQWSNGVAPAAARHRHRRERHGYIDRQGHWVIEPTFDEAGPFTFNTAVVRSPAMTEQFIYISTEGETIWRPEREYGGSAARNDEAANRENLE